MSRLLVGAGTGDARVLSADVTAAGRPYARFDASARATGWCTGESRRGGVARDKARIGEDPELCGDALSGDCGPMIGDPVIRDERPASDGERCGGRVGVLCALLCGGLGLIGPIGGSPDADGAVGA